MNVRLALFWLGLLMAAAVPVAFGQDTAPTARGAESDARSAATMPDFSGVWAHPYFPGFEPPASGPGPILNKSRRWRFHKPDLEAASCRGGEKARRNLTRRR